MPSFNLVDKPWIPVIANGDEREVSLLELFVKADLIDRIVGNPLEAAVLFRLALAILHRVNSPKTKTEWVTVWNNPAEQFKRAAEYLNQNKGLFDLYDSERPFLQNAAVPDSGKGTAEILYDRAQGNNPVFLDASLASEPCPISSGLAARALLVTHSFAGSGLGAINSLNENKKDTMYMGPLCARLIALVETEDLRSSLLLNLVALDQPPIRTAGIPGWERPRVSKPVQSHSGGPADIYSRPTRNAKLRPSGNGDSCLGVALLMGEGVLADDDVQSDPLIPSYFSKNDKKFKAFRLNPNKALWRSSHTLLSPETETHRPLRAVHQLRVLLEEGKVEIGDRLRLRTLGVAADAQGPVTELWRDEALPFTFQVLQNHSAFTRLEEAVNRAENTGESLRKGTFGFAMRYLENGDRAPDPKDVERLLKEMAVDRTFWNQIAAAGERLAVEPMDIEDWLRLLRKASQVAFRTAVETLPADARRMRAEFVSRTDDSKGAKKKAAK